MRRFLVTGGAGFIGSEVVRQLVGAGEQVLVVDKLTYAGNLDSLKSIWDEDNFQFQQLDIVDTTALSEAMGVFQPDAVMHLAAESHVDRSIDGPGAFIETNVVGTASVLQACLAYWKEGRDDFRLLHISTDEVYGSLGDDGAFTESTPYDPSSPYSASKAASDHLVRAWHRTYGLPTLITNCSNNYGPFHFPEKLIPLMILNALEGKPLPVYGEGQQTRDWLFVSDHARALIRVVEEGRAGETYNIGGNHERRNLEVVHTLCDILDRKRPQATSYRELITFVEDRPGHDWRYAIDASKIKVALGWEPQEDFQSGLEKTVDWYLENTWWWERVRSGGYRGDRLGLGGQG